MEDNIKLGTAPFGKMIFTLKRPITKKNHRDYRFMNGIMREIADDIWAMPAYMKEHEDFSMFFIFTKIDSGETVIAFSEGHLDGDKFKLSMPMTSGEGLNHLYQHNDKRAKSVLHFINQISKANEGDWRMVE
ncbi:hypothetical protein WR164_05610 [Philodulcilactobacillus myokoensis]|uniref:Uncharacterized protein n=1 Tax=Philodulcilactobacillus myokoensis TaxID=2929573 RepID=A0A9W6ESK7_9LACO|nr:hypothetical protein [Philodulcilactobacillus myokoensis]GLB46582.1 hypothetical protein WR164_05610 [Philodulcilactobacillus myokoensis]